MNKLDAVRHYINEFPKGGKDRPIVGMIMHKKAKGFKVGNLVAIHSADGKRKLFVHNPDKAPNNEHLVKVSRVHVSILHITQDKRILSFTQSISDQLQKKDQDFKGFTADIIYHEHMKLMNNIHIVREYVGSIEIVHNDRSYCLWITKSSPSKAIDTLQFTYASRQGIYSTIEIQRSINKSSKSVFVDLILEAKRRAIEQINAKQDGTYQKEAFTREDLVKYLNL